jgi:hypothetical protein
VCSGAAHRGPWRRHPPHCSSSICLSQHTHQTPNISSIFGDTDSHILNYCRQLCCWSIYLALC